MNNSIDVSIIIPFYNAQRYVRECLDSIIKFQKLSIEIICVDDGSTDDTVEILKEYREKDSRIILIQQKNMYAGIARNNGMSIAKGHYLTFIDADDMLFSVDTLCKAYDLAVKKDCDLFVCGAVGGECIGKIYSEEWVLKTNLIPSKDVFDAKELGVYATYAFGGAPWAKLYKRSSLEKFGVTFPGFKRSEDFCFVELFVFLSEKISFLNEPLIFHRKNVVGSLENTKDDTPTIFWEASKLQIEEFKEREIWDEFQKSFKFNNIMLLEYHLNSMKTIEGFNEVFNCIKYEVWPFLETIHEEPIDDAYIVNKKKIFNIISFKSSTDYLLSKYNGNGKKVFGFTNSNVENDNYIHNLNELKELKKEIENIKSGLSFKIGRILTWLPRKLLGRR